MKRFILIGWLILPVTIGYGQDFRKANWGSTMAEVTLLFCYSLVGNYMIYSVIDCIITGCSKWILKLKIHEKINWGIYK